MTLALSTGLLKSFDFQAKRLLIFYIKLLKIKLILSEEILIFTFFLHRGFKQFRD